MSGTDKGVRGAIDDARALLDTLLASGWEDVHILSGETEIYIARAAGRTNPMRAAAPEVETFPPDGATIAIKAPHVATLVEAAAIGTAVPAGAPVVRLRVLDEPIEVVAAVGGTVTAHHASVGELVEYGAAIVSMAEAAE